MLPLFARLPCCDSIVPSSSSLNFITVLVLINRQLWQVTHTDCCGTRVSDSPVTLSNFMPSLSRRKGHDIVVLTSSQVSNRQQQQALCVCAGRTLSIHTMKLQHQPSYHLRTKPCWFLTEKAQHVSNNCSVTEGVFLFCTIPLAGELLMDC